MASKFPQDPNEGNVSFGCGRINLPRQHDLGPDDIQQYYKYGLSPYILNEFRHEYLDPTKSGEIGEDIIIAFYEERFKDYHCVDDETMAQDLTANQFLERYKLVLKKYADDEAYKKSINSTILDGYSGIQESLVLNGSIDKVFTARITLAGMTINSTHIRSYNPKNVVVMFLKNMFDQSLKFYCGPVHLIVAVHDVNEIPLKLTHLGAMETINTHKYIKSEEEHAEFCYEIGNTEKISEAIVRKNQFPNSSPPKEIIKTVNIMEYTSDLVERLKSLNEKEKEIIDSGARVKGEKLSKMEKKQIAKREAATKVSATKSKSNKKVPYNKKQQLSKQQKDSTTSSDEEDENLKRSKKSSTISGPDAVQYGTEDYNEFERRKASTSSSMATVSAPISKGPKTKPSKMAKKRARNELKRTQSKQSLSELNEDFDKSRDLDTDDDQPPETNRGDDNLKSNLAPNEFERDFSLPPVVYSQLDKKFIDIASFLEGKIDETYTKNFDLMKQKSTTLGSIISFLVHADSLLQESFSLLDGLRVNIAQLLASNDVNGFEAAYRSSYLKFHTLRIEFSEKINNYIEYFLSIDLMRIFDNVIDILTYFKVKVQFTYLLGYILKFNPVFGHLEDGLFNNIAVSFQAVKSAILMYTGNELNQMADTENRMVTVMTKMNDLELLWSLYEQQVQTKLLDYQTKGTYAATDLQKNLNKELCQLNGQYKMQINAIKSELMAEINLFSPPFAIMKSDIERQIWTLFDGVFKDILAYFQLPYFEANLNLCDRICAKKVPNH